MSNASDKPKPPTPADDPNALHTPAPEGLQPPQRMHTRMPELTKAGAKKITRDLYDEMVKAFREYPGHYTWVSKRLKINKRTAMRAWNEGWMPRLPWARPIKEVLAEEQEAVRIARVKKELQAQQEEEDRRVQARLDAINARAQEGQMANIGRRNAINLAVLSGRMLVACEVLVVELETRLKVASKVKSMPTEEIKKTLDLTTSTLSRSATLMRAAVELERIITGEPIAVLGVKAAESMTPEGMLDVFTRMKKAIDRDVAAGVLPATPEYAAESGDGESTGVTSSRTRNETAPAQLAAVNERPDLFDVHDGDDTESTAAEDALTLRVERAEVAAATRPPRNSLFDRANN